MTDKSNVIPYREPRAKSLRRAIDEWRDTGERLVEKTMVLAAELLAARIECGGDDVAFGRWLVENGCEDDCIGPNARAALIQIAQTPEISREVMATSKRNSIRYIYELEIKPRLISTHLGKDTPPASLPIELQEITQNPQIESEMPLQENTNSEAAIDLPRAKLATKGKTSGRPSPISHLPEADLVGGHLLDAETRRTLSGLVRGRGGRAIWYLVIESIKRGYFGEPSKANIKIPSLRLVMPWLPTRSLREFDICKSSVQALVREVIFPLLDDERHLRNAEHHHKIEGRIEARRRQIEEQRRRETILSQHKEQVAQSTLPVNEQPVIAYGDPLWPPLGDLSARFTYEELCHACWYADYFMGIARPDWKPRELAMAARHLTKYVEPLRPGFVRAVDAIFNAYQAQPDGEKRFPRTPVNFGLS